MAGPVITLREVNRATLARQMLLKRQKMTALKAIEALAGLQAQVPRAPFIALWSRLDDFKRADLAELLLARRAIRATMMRATIHLTTTKDFVDFRNTLQPGLSQAVRSVLQERMDGVDIEARVAEGRRFLDEEPRTFDEFRKALARTEPTTDVRAVAYVVQVHLPLARVPDQSAWNFKSNADFVPAETWLGKPISPAMRTADLMFRYLGAFGPATVADAQTWSGLRGLRDVFEEMRPKLTVLRDEKGRELFDLKKAPRPSADTPAPIRFLPDYDNLLLAYADRERVISEDFRQRIATPNLIGVPTFLADGFVAGRWRTLRDKKAAILEVTPFGPLAAGARKEIEAEGKRLLRFVEDGAEKFEVRFAT